MREKADVPDSLLKRRQIRDPRACATATAYLLRRVVKNFKVGDVQKLVETVQETGHRLIKAQPTEMAIGNIVGRILSVIRDEAEEDREGETSTHSDAGSESQALSSMEHNSEDLHEASPSSRTQSLSPLRNGDVDIPGAGLDSENQQNSHTAPSTAPSVTSILALRPHTLSSSASPAARSGFKSLETQTSLSNQTLANLDAAKELREEVIEGIQEILDELNQADDQIAGYALENIHSNEIILSYGSSITVQKFLLKAATKRKFSVFHAEAYPNDHEITHSSLIGKAKGEPEGLSNVDIFRKTLTAAGITVILIPDSAVYALMSRVNKVIFDTQVILAKGGLVAAAGATLVAKAARKHHTQVVVLSAVYKLSPVESDDIDGLDIDTVVEDGDPSKIIAYEEGDFINEIEVENRLFDYVHPDLIDLYITNV